MVDFSAAPKYLADSFSGVFRGQRSAAAATPATVELSVLEAGLARVHTSRPPSLDGTQPAITGRPSMSSVRSLSLGDASKIQQKKALEVVQQFRDLGPTAKRQKINHDLSAIKSDFEDVAAEFSTNTSAATHETAKQFEEILGTVVALHLLKTHDMDAAEKWCREEENFKGNTEEKIRKAYALIHNQSASLTVQPTERRVADYRTNQAHRTRRTRRQSKIIFRTTIGCIAAVAGYGAYRAGDALFGNHDGGSVSTTPDAPWPSYTPAPSPQPAPYPPINCTLPGTCGEIPYLNTTILNPPSNSSIGTNTSTPDRVQ